MIIFVDFCRCDDSLNTIPRKKASSRDLGSAKPPIRSHSRIGTQRFKQLLVDDASIQPEITRLTYSNPDSLELGWFGIALVETVFQITHRLATQCENLRWHLYSNLKIAHAFDDTSYSSNLVLFRLDSMAYFAAHKMVPSFRVPLKLSAVHGSVSSLAEEKVPDECSAEEVDGT